MHTVGSSATALTVGATVRHPSRGTGKVVTIVYNPLHGRPAKAWVEFGNIGFGKLTQKFCCFAEDLTVVPEGTAQRPVLRAVEPAPVEPLGAA